MKLLDIVQRTSPPVAWQEGDNIPWHEAGFSARMLAEHLTQAHDHASRRATIIDQHVAWIHQTVLHGQPAQILDLGCGPGLYCNRLAALGHTCVGIDYSPASIAYARQQATQAGVAVTYVFDDMRAAAFGGGYDLAMLLFGELNVFSQQDATHILEKVYAALQPGGVLLLEPHTYDSLQPDRASSTSWYSSPGGLFLPSPHLVLIEEHWDAEASTLARRYYVADANTAETTRYAQTMQAYDEIDYRRLLQQVGFTQIEFYPGLAYDRIATDPTFCAIAAVKPT